MSSKTYILNGIIDLTLPSQRIEVTNFKVEAYSEKQAKYLLAIDLSNQRGFNRNYIYKRILKSKIKATLLKGGLQ